MSKDREPASGSCAELARRADPDRFLTALPAPAAARERLFALIAFNHELVRAVELPSARSGAGSIAALVRLQWWREVVEGDRDDWHGQPVATALRGLLAEGAVRAETLLELVAAREAEAEGLGTLEEWRAAMRSGPGGLQRAIGEALGVAPDAGDRPAGVGAAYPCGALRRHLPVVLASGRCPLPDEMLEQAGTAREGLATDPGPVPGLREALKREGETFLRQAAGRPLGRGQRAALLPLVLARRDLARPVHVQQVGRGLGDRIAVLFGRP